MLVLTRRAGESIVIDGHITVTVLEARGDQIRIGVEAPRDVAIHREEVYRAVEEENTAAAASAARAQALLGSKPPDLSNDRDTS
ncbi:carbon storage regulator [Egibacter rhizosphaerae]|uniref:Translational regulator CsrA n=1 Tax=Egibacter rhizosphaerae TaxID=1670831 RepID=A0A411YCJ2_9ACTN|nr:carbon storage regulator CsrA [Egibacter rhizosphaerae]QBI18934.1 carbon storage regulator [Egibacter rhizosphaerae]